MFKRFILKRPFYYCINQTIRSFEWVDVWVWANPPSLPLRSPTETSQFQSVNFCRETRLITSKWMYFTIHNVLQDYKGQKLAEQIFQGIILVSAVCNHNTWKHDITFPCALLIITTDVAPVGNWICLWADNWTVWVDSVHSAGWICCVLCGKLIAFTSINEGHNC